MGLGGGRRAVARLALIGATALLSLYATATADTVINPFSGQWTTDLGGGVTGTVKFSALTESAGIAQLQAMGGHPCAAPTTYYHGDFTDTGGKSGEAGTMTACLVTAGHLVGRYHKSDPTLPYPGGDLDITLNSAKNVFNGFSTADDPMNANQRFQYNGTFNTHFPGDGCCTTTTPPPTGLGAPSRFCPPKRAVASVASLQCVTMDYIESDAKGQARQQLRAQLKQVVMLCGISSGNVIGSGSDTRLLGRLLIELCRVKVLELGATLAVVQEPPLGNFHRIDGLTAAARASAQNLRCPSRLDARHCTALLSAGSNYLNAVAAVSRVANVLAKSANRFAGARHANSPAAAFLQESAGKIYAGVMASRLHTEELAGSALAQLISADHLDVGVNAMKTKRLDAKLAGQVVSNQLLDQLVADGTAATRARARTMFRATLTSASGPQDLAAAVGAALPASDFDRHYRTIAMSELNAVVVGLRDQGDLSNAAATTLTKDLAGAQAACGDATRRGAAIQKFISHANSLADSLPANLLVLAARPLSAAGLAVSSCA